MSTVVTTLPARKWRIESTSGRPLTVNAVVDLHRMQWARHTAASREAWGWLARAARIPALDQITVTVTPLHRNRRSPQDVAACAPEAKAAIDGLVDAGVIPDDNARHLLAVTFTPPDVCGVDGMALVVEEAS